MGGSEKKPEGGGHPERIWLMMATVNGSQTPGALDGLSILDFSRVLAGPFATMMLADLGATVTKVERPGTGDETRTWGPPHDEHGNATYFQAVNRNKQSVVLDLAAPADLGRARELAGDADVIVENFRPGVMDNSGLATSTWRRPTRDWSTARSPASGAGPAPSCPAMTCSCRQSVA